MRERGGGTTHTSHTSHTNCTHKSQQNTRTNVHIHSCKAHKTHKQPRKQPTTQANTPSITNTPSTQRSHSNTTAPGAIHTLKRTDYRLLSVGVGGLRVVVASFPFPLLRSLLFSLSLFFFFFLPLCFPLLFLVWFGGRCALVVLLRFFAFRTFFFSLVHFFFFFCTRIFFFFFFSNSHAPIRRRLN